MCLDIELELSLLSLIFVVGTDKKKLSEEELIKRDAPSDSEEPLEVSISYDLKI